MQHTVSELQHKDDPDAMELAAASLDEPQRLPSAREIWHSQKVSWAASESTIRHFSRESQSGPDTGV